MIVKYVHFQDCTADCNCDRKGTALCSLQKVIQCLSVSLSVSMSLTVFQSFSVSLSFSVSTSLPVFHFLCLCVALSFSVALSLCLFIAMSLCLYVSLCLFIQRALYSRAGWGSRIESLSLSLCLFSLCLSNHVSHSINYINSGSLLLQEQLFRLPLCYPLPFRLHQRNL